MSVDSTMKAMRASRGHARQFWHVFENSRVPMVMVDTHMRYRAANAPARLIFRMSLDELIQHRLGDLSPPERRGLVHEHWERLMRVGSVAGPHDAEFPDGGRLRIVYCALANALPGLHLVVFAPADWPDDDFADGPEPVGPTSQATGPASLSQREREVLSLIAAGSDQQEIAEELTIAVATVRTHVRNLLRKLGARNRPHAIALAMQAGLFGAPLRSSDEPVSSDERASANAAGCVA